MKCAVFKSLVYVNKIHWRFLVHVCLCKHTCEWLEHSAAMCSRVQQSHYITVISFVILSPSLTHSRTSSNVIQSSGQASKAINESHWHSLQDPSAFYCLSASMTSINHSLILPPTPALQRGGRGPCMIQILPIQKSRISDRAENRHIMKYTLYIYFHNPRNPILFQWNKILPYIFFLVENASHYRNKIGLGQVFTLTWTRKNCLNLDSV